MPSLPSSGDSSLGRSVLTQLPGSGSGFGAEPDHPQLLPPSPAVLKPASPKGFSNISSLASSLEMPHPTRLFAASELSSSRPDPSSHLDSLRASAEAESLEASTSSTGGGIEPHVHSETQALMQMLSMVGSRFFEAEGEGVMEDDDSDEPPHVHEHDPLAVQPPSLPQAHQYSRSRIARPERNWLTARNDLFDDQATPRGGQTPLAASTTSVAKAKKLSPGSNVGGLGSSHVKRAESGRYGLADLSIDTGEEGDSEDSGAAETMPFGEQSDSVLGEPFEPPAATYAPTDDVDPHLQAVSNVSDAEDADASSKGPSRSGDDRDQLLAQLRRLFDLEPAEELISAHRCWLFRSVLLQGHVYLTTGHLCFYAYMPSRENRLLRAGPMGKLTRRTHRFSKHWATLKSGLLSWFDNARDPYFPQGFIDLRRVSSIEASIRHADRFKVVTPYRRFTFQVESEASRNAWIAALRKEVFKAHNEGESVKISIPLETIIDVDTTLSVDQTEMVCIKVVDELADFAIDEYFFLHFSRRDEFLRAVRHVALDNVQPSADPLRWSRTSIHDSTSAMQNTVTLQTSLDDVPIVPISNTLKRQGSSASTKTMSSTKTSTQAALANAGVRGPMAIARNQIDDGRAMAAEGDADQLSCTPTARMANQGVPDMSFIYPPSPSGSDPPPTFDQTQKEADRGWAIPKWIRDTPAKVLGGGPAADVLASWMGGASSRRKHRRIVELWPKDAGLSDLPDEGQTEQTGFGEDLASSGYSSYSVLDAPEEEPDALTEGERFEEHFREIFGLLQDERLLGHVHATLFRVLPITGRAFLSSRHLAFRSSGLASKTVGRTLMLIPLSDIISAARQPALRFGQHGIVITVRGHEEVFLEVSSPERREELLSLLDLQLDRCKTEGGNDGLGEASGSEKSRALVLRDLSEQLDNSFDSASASSSTLSSHLSTLGQSSSMMRSDSSALLNFKPNKPLVFTMLTIGSRGDVQPYIALGKGLQADGHRVRIASHPEFGDWVRGHDIEFSEIGGDPAELMRICVENGTFTVSFLREGVTKFRGWLDDLLLSSWKACQGSDVIIESPSAIAGIHVAEALQVPYYRAFTMPWTRTRAYPHAFAVPGNKAGGNYNYMSYVIFDQIFWRAAAGQINRWRKKHLGLRSTNIDKLEQHKVPFIYNFSPSLVPRPLDWFEWIHVTGFWFLDNPDSSSSRAWQPPADLLAFIDRARANDRKLVYIGWGSIVVSDAEAMTRCVLEAVKKSGVCAIISKGWSDRLSKGSDSKPAMDPILLQDVYQVSSVPHDWLFPLIDAACHHGGAGTLGASLRAGLPTIVKPYFGDQFFWGQQVESLGVGSCVKNLTVDALAAALKMATTNVKQIERARKLGAQIRAEDGVGEAIKAIYRDLDYARSRIKRDTRLPTDAKATPQMKQAPMGPRDVDEASAMARSSSASSSSHHRDPTLATAPATIATALSAAPGDTSRDQSTCSAEHTSDEWSDVGAPWSPSICSSQDDPSSSLVLAAEETI
ncbi:Sterol 3-beta-glucosyltransferase [Thecaphora frezii]